MEFVGTEIGWSAPNITQVSKRGDLPVVEETCVRIGCKPYFPDPCIRPFDNVVVGSQLGESPAMVWFSHWFVCPLWWEQWYQPRPDSANPVTWHRVRDKVTKHYADGRTYIWIMQDEWDCRGRQLGVWPD